MRFIGSITPIIRFLRKKEENNTVYTFQEIYYLLVSKEEKAIVCHCAIRKGGGRGKTFTLVKSFNKHRDVETPVEISARRFAIDSLLLLIGGREGRGEACSNFSFRVRSSKRHVSLCLRDPCYILIESGRRRARCELDREISSRSNECNARSRLVKSFSFSTEREREALDCNYLEK